MITPLTPLEFGRRAFKLYPSRLAVIDGEYRATYQTLAARVYQLARAVRAAGINPGDRVAVLAPNSHVMLEAFYGVPWAGAVMVPLNTRLNTEEYAYILEHSGTRLLIADSELIEPVRGLLPGLEKVVIAGPGEPDWENYEDWIGQEDTSPLPLPDIDENAMITLNYTSGTTARPKGVMLTHRNTYINAVDFLLHMRMQTQDRYLHVLPMFHANGWGDVWAVSAVGAVHSALRKVAGPQLWEAIESQDITALCGAPAVLNMLATTPHQPLNHPVRVATAGAPPPSRLIADLSAEHIEVIHVYGLTEVSPWITISESLPEDDELSAEARAEKMACQGVEQLLSGEVRVVRLDGTDVVSDGEEVGEIVCRGNVVMAGYYHQAEETAKAMENGWFHTGDLAVIHPSGYVQIKDRSKDMIISGGENISSVEVEDLLYRHPAVYEAAVVAVPDPQWGETPKAFIVTNPGQEVSSEELRRFCRDHLTHYKVPSSFEFVDALPRTASGKIQKFVLRQPYWAERGSGVN